jgi:hypothetical protein
MKRLLVCFALALGLLLPAAAKAQLPTFQLSQELLDFMAAAPAADDLVAGEGKFAPTEQGESMQFTLSAHGPGGATPFVARGNVRIKINGVARRATVDCLVVTGNFAHIEGTFDEPIPTFGAFIGPFPDVVIQVIDNGEPNGQNPRDTARVILDADVNPCVFEGFIISNGPIAQGNIVVMERP